MKKAWRTLKRRWLDSRKDDEEGALVYNLSRSDRRNLWYGAFMACISAVALFSIVIALVNTWSTYRYAQDIEEIMGMIATYMGSATQDEYEEIAKTIRNDLVVSQYGQDIENYIKYIPNTAERCCICTTTFPSQVYLICVNTAQLYELDLVEDRKLLYGNRGDYTSVSFGYDEISESNLYITKNPRKHQGKAILQRKRGIFSIQRMKALFCDDCIRKILEAVKNQLVEEFVIFDTEQKKFYPVDDGVIRIGDYVLQIEYDKNYEISIQYEEEQGQAK